MNDGESVFANLGLQKVINAFEVVTMYGGSIMRPEVLDAMVEASHSFIDITELNRAVGERIALLTRNEAAFVTAGCAAALALSLAACMTGGNCSLADLLPNTTGMRNEVVIHRCQRNPYDHALQITGARIIEFGYPTHKVEPRFLEEVLNDQTAAVFYFAGRMFERYALSLEKTTEIAHRHGIPVVVDAAAQIPPRENLWNYTQRGADLVLFSGGKGIRGPQNSGLVLGRRDLVDAVAKISSPYQTFGRPMKTSRETVVGLFRAVELLLSEDWKSNYQIMMGKLKELLRTCEDLSTFDRTWILPTGRHGQEYPRAVFRLREGIGVSRDEFIIRLRDGNPSVIVGALDEDERAFYVNPFGFQSEEEYKIVAMRIREEAISKL